MLSELSETWQAKRSHGQRSQASKGKKRLRTKEKAQFPLPSFLLFFITSIRMQVVHNLVSKCTKMHVSKYILRFKLRIVSFGGYFISNYYARGVLGK